MPVDLVLVGAGGFGRESLDVVEAINLAGKLRYHVLGIADDAPSDLNLRRLHERGYQHLGAIADVIDARPTTTFVLGIGDPADRRRLADRFESAGWHPATLLHPSAGLGSLAEIGPGSIVCAGVQVSTNVRLGRYVHLNPNATVGHDAELADFVSVNPGVIVSGEVVIETGVLVGSGSVILQRLRVGQDSTIGASSCVTRDVPRRVVVKGVPGRWS